MSATSEAPPKTAPTVTTVPTIPTVTTVTACDGKGLDQKSSHGQLGVNVLPPRVDLDERWQRALFAPPERRAAGFGLVVAGIDFGTAASGASIALRSSPDKVAIVTPLQDLRPAPNRGAGPNVRNMGPPTAPGGGHKVTTALLLDGRTLQVVAFGDLARELYMTEGLDADGTSNQRYVLFDRFKMQLYGKKLPKSIVAHCGREVPVLDVLTEMMRVLRFSVIHHLDQVVNPAQKDAKTDGKNDGKNDGKRDGERDGEEVGEGWRVSEDDMSWVVTVPTLWNDQAKHLMWAAAMKSGMKKVQILLESEAAAVACRYNTLSQAERDDLLETFRQGRDDRPSLEPSEDGKRQSHVVDVNRKALKTGDKVMVMDGGGGTFDITVHKVGEQSRLLEAEPFGGPWGSEQVDAAFVKLFDTVFGARFMEKYARMHPTDFSEIRAEIQRLKHSIEPLPSEGAVSADDDLRLVLPASFLVASGLADVPKSVRVFLRTDSDTVGVRCNLAPSDAPPTVKAHLANKLASDLASKLVINAPSAKSEAKLDPVEVLRSMCKMQTCTAPPEGERYVRQLDGKINVSANMKYVGYSSGTLRISAPLAVSIMLEVIEPIRQHLDAGLGTPGISQTQTRSSDKSVARGKMGNIVACFAVGGFCESQLLRHTLKTRYGPMVQFPVNPVSSVLTGAVLFGLNPRMIGSRVMTRHYGLERCLMWDRDDHRIEQECTKDTTSRPGAVICQNHFKLLCRKGQVVSPDKAFFMRFTPLSPTQTKMVVDLHCTDTDVLEPPNRIDTGYTTLLGQIAIDMPDIEHGLNRQITVDVRFGANITVSAFNKTTNESVTATFQLPE